MQDPTHYHPLSEIRSTFPSYPEEHRERALLLSIPVTICKESQDSHQMRGCEWNFQQATLNSATEGGILVIGTLDPQEYARRGGTE